MKLVHLALKDLMRSLRSAFLIVMVLVVPLGLGGLMYLAFGGAGSSDGPRVASTRVLVVDRDEGVGAFRAADVLLDALRSEDTRDLVTVGMADDEDAARAAVDRQEAGVAVLIPADLTSALVERGSSATVTLYSDPTLTVGPEVVRAVVSEVVDALAASDLALRVTAEQLADRGLAMGPGELQELGARFWEAKRAVPGGPRGGHPLLRVVGASNEGDSTGGMEFGGVLAGLMIFGAFFGAVYSVESIIREDEEGTLARLFATPTPRGMILGSKFLSAGVVVVGQTSLVMAITALALGIEWGRPGAVALLVVGMIASATGMGVFLMSLVRTTRQSGVVVGAGLTVSSMLGGLFSAAAPGIPEAVEAMYLVFPQGWAMRGWLLAQAGGGAGDVWPTVLAMVAYGGVLFAIGTLRFRRRFA